MVKMFSKSIQGKYGFSFPKFSFGIFILLTIIFSSLSSISWHFSLEQIKADLVYYLIILITGFAFIKLLRGFKSSIYITNNSIVFYHLGKKTEVKLMDISKAYYDKRLTLELGKDSIMMPENTKLSQYSLFLELKALGVECHEHTSD